MVDAEHDDGQLDTGRILAILLRRWWLVLGLPVAAVLGTVLFTRDQPYVATFQASILIPMDTEDPGDAERPELMVGDDLPLVIGSQRFAELVEAELDRAGGPVTLAWPEIQASIRATRYSRIMRVEVTRDDGEEAMAIAAAAATVLPGAVNQFAVPVGEPPARTPIIDAPSVRREFVSERPLVLAVQFVVALGVGIGLAALAHALDDRLHSEMEVTATLGVPLLGDLRRDRWSRPGSEWVRGDRR